MTTAPQAKKEASKGVYDESQFTDLSNFNTSLASGSIKKAMAEAGAKSSDLWQVPLEHLHILPGFNMRLRTPEYEAHLDNIEKSIREKGYFKHEPMTGFVGVDPNDSTKQKIFITEGHTRHESAGRVQRGTKDHPPKDVGLVTVIIKNRDNAKAGGKVDAQGGTEDSRFMAEMTVASFHSNNGNKRYTTLETALLCLRLRENHKRETFQIAEALNLSKAYVETLLVLARAPKTVRDMVQVGNLSATVAIETLKKKGADAEKVLVKAAETAKARIEASTVAAKPAAPAAAKQGETVKTASTPSSTPATGTVATAKPAAAPAPAKKVVITKADVSPEEKVMKEKQRLGPRLFDEIKRLVDVEKSLTLTPELEKIFFLIENVQ